ncbi:hypothetical protein JTE90_000869 [Oedothorax gibbosus]|uniref:Superoxide dismutase copper/zinc binding domain-containing protein n=1 Tax=Oedothorax gibbosus TaxID=931172 RepID=A0AAV6VUK1_9ARAC|nr:hypothetical protein JTE90_000869 [Oedothorax gibbosus]
MFRSVFLLGLLVVFVQSYAQHQVQMPEASSLLDQDEGLFAQVQELQKNVTEIWTYIHTLRNAVTEHLNHLRQHQVELESTVHRLEHAGQSGTHASHTDDHHSGEHGHSHSGEHHSHSGEHGHSHSGEHSSHGDDHQHSHSGEQHSHSGGDDHHHESHSHSHSHGSEDSHSSHTDGDHQHMDHHESEDVQQSHQGADPLPEPLVVPVHRQSHTHHHQPASSTPKPIGMQLMTEQGHHHHHHDHQAPQAMSSVRNLTRVSVVMPKYSEYALYDLAVCNVQSNRAIPESQQQNVMGQVTLWQKKSGGPLNVHVRLQGFSMGDHHGAHQAIQTLQNPHGALHQAHSEDNEEAPAKGHKHGFHVHTNGDLSNGCQSTGPHYNPKSVNHGAPDALVRHVGDFGKIECDDHGITNQVFSDNIASLTGPYSIIGKSMVIHSLEDDLGLGGDEESLRTGNAGTRIACCVIQKVEKIPIRSYKAMKTAVQRKN